MGSGLSPVRCPGFRGSEENRVYHHASWRARAPTSPYGNHRSTDKPYECMQCGADYEYLVDLRAGKRVAPNTDDEPGAHPDDPEHYKSDTNTPQRHA